jgi:WD40-like Beta Propeller Repeat
MSTRGKHLLLRSVFALAALVVAVAIAAIAAGQSRAAFPGTNGKIVFETNRDGNEEIYTMNADGTGVTRVTHDGNDDRRPTWTADGHILFQNGSFPNRAIFRIGADGNGLQQLTPVSSDNATVAAAPKGGRIAFSSTRGDGTQRLFTANADGSAAQLVLPSPPGPETADVEADWSPRGNLLVFDRFTFGEPLTSHLYVVRADGTGLRRLTNTADRLDLQPAWSADGTKISFLGASAVGTANEHDALYTMNSDGSGVTEISTPRAPYLDDFSADRVDPFWFGPNIVGSGPAVVQTNGRLEVSIPSATLNDPGTGFTDAGVSTQCLLLGDYDVQVDYQLLQWPPQSGVNVDFNTNTIVNGSFDQTFGLFVFDPGGGTGVSTNFPGPTNTFVPAPETVGTLRFVRIGPMLTAYRLTPTGWSAIQSTSEVANEVGVSLDLFSNAPQFSHPDVKVAYDNFRVNSGSFSCPSWWRDNASNWQPLQ